MKYTLVTCAIMTALLTTNTFAQESTEQEIESITVVASKPDGIKISSSKLLSLPGTGNDPLKGLEALPGVVLATPSTGGPVAQPAIRGSSTNDNLYLTDGLEMGYVFHNDGLSIYNPLLVESFELKTGAWNSQYADANGGVILTQLRDPDGSAPQKVLDLSFFRSGFLYEQALTDNAAFYVSFRESLVYTYVDNFIEDEDFSFAVPPRNRDYQAKLIWDIDADNTLRLLMSGAKDYIEIAFDEDGRDIAKNPDLASGERYQTYFHSQALSWERIGEQIESLHSINFLTQNQQEREGDIFSWDADISKVILKSDNTFYGDDYSVKFGAQFKQTQVDYISKGRLLPCNLEFEVCPPSYFSPTFSDENKLDIQTYQAYASVNGSVNTLFDYQVGMAVVGSDRNDQQYFEPRVRLSKQLSEAHNLSLSYGKHHTFIDDYQYVTTVFGEQDLDASSTSHWVMGLDSQLDGGWGVKTEVFYKSFDNLLIANPSAQQRQQAQDITGQARFADVATGEAYGLELLVNKQLSDDWYGWASIAYSKTQRDNPLTGQSFNSEFDLPWIANLVLDYKLNESWQIGAKWRFQSGRRYTDVLKATPYQDEAGDVLFHIPEYGQFNAQQWGNYHRLDIRADYQTNLMGLDANIYFEVLNVYGSRTVQELEYNADYSDYEKDYQFPDMPLPSVGITLNF